MNQMDETLSLRIEATNGAHPAPVTLLNCLKWTYVYLHIYICIHVYKLINQLSEMDTFKMLDARC